MQSVCNGVQSVRCRENNTRKEEKIKFKRCLLLETEVLRSVVFPVCLFLKIPKTESKLYVERSRESTNQIVGSTGISTSKNSNFGDSVAPWSIHDIIDSTYSMRNADRMTEKKKE